MGGQQVVQLLTSTATLAHSPVGKRLYLSCILLCLSAYYDYDRYHRLLQERQGDEEGSWLPHLILYVCVVVIALLHLGASSSAQCQVGEFTCICKLLYVTTQRIQFIWCWRTLSLSREQCNTLTLASSCVIPCMTTSKAPAFVSNAVQSHQHHHA